MTTPKAETPPRAKLSDMGDGRWSLECGFEYADGFHVRVEWDTEQDPDHPEWRAEVFGLPSNISAGSTFGFGPSKEAAMCDLICALATLAQALNDPPPEPSDD